MQLSGNLALTFRPAGPPLTGIEDRNNSYLQTSFSWRSLAEFASVKLYLEKRPYLLSE